MTAPGSEIRSAFRGELADLRDRLVRMATFVEDMLLRAMEALLQQDVDLAEEVRISDDVPDQLDLEVERDVNRLLALQQPMARDLRAITAALRMAADLERIGDYARDIAKAARRMQGQPYFWPLEDIPVMGSKVAHMLRQAVRCFVDRDIELAVEIGRLDEEVDTLWKRLRDQLMDHMREDPKYVDQAVQLLLVARYLERIGDHVVNVCERVYFMETGEIVSLN